MDNYPQDLAPEFEEGGAVKTPFEEWWARVGTSFPNVPENVARYWLHEHWNQSSYSFLASSAYTFRLIDWPSADLWRIHSVWDDFQEDNSGCFAKGRQMIQQYDAAGPDDWMYKTTVYMVKERNFPAPIIVLDNRDNHIASQDDDVAAHKLLPASYVLIEGHRRFNMALYLQREGRFDPTCKVWLMERVQHPVVQDGGRGGAA